jgi:hypothetical protein
VILPPTNPQATITPESKLQPRDYTKIATIDLDNIQFYSPNPPPPSKSRGTCEPSGIPTGNFPVCAPQFTFPAVPKASAQTECLGHLERPFTSSLALPKSTIQQQSTLPHAAETDFNEMLEEFRVTDIKAIDLNADDFFDFLLSWASEELC